MAHIIETLPDGTKKTHVIPGKSRIADELQRVFPCARFVACDLTPTGGDRVVPCLELRYVPPNMKSEASICAVPLGETENDRSLAPLTLMRHAFRKVGFNVAITEISTPVVNEKKSRTKSRKAMQLDRIWRFTYTRIPEETEETKQAEPITTAAPDEKKESTPDGLGNEAT